MKQDADLFDAILHLLSMIGLAVTDGYTGGQPWLARLLMDNQPHESGAGLFGDVQALVTASQYDPETAFGDPEMIAAQRRLGE